MNITIQLGWWMLPLAFFGWMMTWYALEEKEPAGALFVFFGVAVIALLTRFLP